MTKFPVVAPDICGPPVQNLHHGTTLLAPRILSFLLDFWRICGPLEWNSQPHA